MMKRIFALLLCAATLLTSLAFVGCSSDKDEEDKGQYITTYLTDNIYDLDPARAYKNEAMSKVVGLLFDTLFKLDEKGKVKESLVDEYVIEEDAEAGEYTMKLYLKDTKWSDGTAVSANDIVFAWQRLLQVDSDFEAASLLFDIKNARAAKEGDVSIDDVGIFPAEQQMLEINFEEPAEGQKVNYDQFLFNLTSLALAPLRDEIVSKSPDWAKKAGTMVCSGPFKLGRINYTEGHPDDSDLADSYFDEHHVVTNAEGAIVAPEDDPTYFPSLQRATDFLLERNTYYYRDFNKDKLDKSVTPYKICVDCTLTDEQLIDMYEKGLIMYIGDIPFSLRENATIQKNVEVADSSLSTNSIYLNQNADVHKGSADGEEVVKLFADAKVRQALSMAIDRDAIQKAVVYAEVATGLLPTGMYEAGSAKKTFRDACNPGYAALTTNVESAKTLLTEAGIKASDYYFTLTYADYDDVHTYIAETVAAAWYALGFNVTLKPLGTVTNNDYYKYTAETPSDICDDLYAEALDYGSFDAILFDYVAYTPDPFSMLAPFALAFSGRAMDMSNLDDYKLTPHITGYNSEAYNAKLEEIFAEKDVTKRAQMYRDAEAILMEDMPVIPIIFNLNANVVSSKLKGGDVDYYGTFNFKKCKVSSYNSYLEKGFEYFVTNFKPADTTQVVEYKESKRDTFASNPLWNLKFLSSKGCTYTSWDLLVDANTIYMHFFAEERARLEALEEEAKEAAAS